MGVCLVVVSDQTYHRGVICKLDYSVGTMNRNAVIGEQGVQKSAQHTTLWHAGARGDR